MFHALISGGSGFIGLHLSASLLAQGCRVTIVDNFKRGLRDDSLSALEAQANFKVIEGDLSNTASIALLPDDVEVIYHCAAIVGVENVVKTPYSVLTLNNLLTENMLKYATGLKQLKAFVFFSTSEVYAAGLNIIPTDFPTPETQALLVPELHQPRTSYALSKIYGEALCHMAGVPFVIVRPHNIYGPRMGNSHVIPQLAQRIKAASSSGQAVEVYSPDHTRTFCYIADACEYLLRLVQSSTACGQTFNLGVSTPETSCMKLAELIREQVAGEVTLTRGSNTPGSPARRVPDTSNLIKITDYLPQVSFVEGVAKTVDWYLSR